MSEVDDLLARVEAEHGSEVADVVRRCIEAGPPPNKSRPFFDGKRDNKRAGHGLGIYAAAGRHSHGLASSVGVRDMPSR